MSDSTSTLQEAYELIELGKFAEARSLLKPHLELNPSPDILWVYMHAVEDPEEGKQILSQLNAIAPDYPGVNALNNRLGFTPATKQIGFDHEKLEEEPDIDTELEDFSSAKDSDRRVPILAIILSFVIVGAVILVLVNPFGSADQQPETQLAQATEFQTPVSSTTQESEIKVESTIAEATIEPMDTVGQSNPLTASNFEMLFADFDLSQTEPYFQEETELGNTTFIRLCSVPGPVAAAHIANAMNVFASIPEISSEAVGVVVRNCTTETDLRSIAVSVSDLNAYATGEITNAEFNRLLQPVR